MQGRCARNTHRVRYVTPHAAFYCAPPPSQSSLRAITGGTAIRQLVDRLHRVDPHLWTVSQTTVRRQQIVCVDGVDHHALPGPGRAANPGQLFARRGPIVHRRRRRKPGRGLQAAAPWISHQGGRNRSRPARARDRCYLQAESSPSASRSQSADASSSRVAKRSR
jgi:hypothetical protein